MPADSARQRLGSVRDAAIGQFMLLTQQVAALDESALHMPTRCDGWRVAELIAHLTRGWDAIRSALDKPQPREADIKLIDYYDEAEKVADAVRQRSIDDADGLSATQLQRRFSQIVEEVADRLRAVTDDRLIVARLGSYQPHRLPGHQVCGGDRPRPRSCPRYPSNTGRFP